MSQQRPTQCPECNGTGGATRVRDYVRGDRTEWCQRCDGYGKVYHSTGGTHSADVEPGDPTHPHPSADHRAQIATRVHHCPAHSLTGGAGVANALTSFNSIDISAFCRVVPLTQRWATL